MDEQLLKALLQEHNQLSVAFDKHASVGYGVPPLVLTAISALFTFVDTSKQFVGLAIPVLILGALLWIGVGHSVLNHMGLKLVELELRINRLLGVDTSTGMNFYTEYVAEGSQIIRGMTWHILVTGIVGATFISIGLYQTWAALAPTHYSVLAKISILAFPVVLGLATILNIATVERNVKKRKLQLIAAATGRRSDPNDTARAAT